MSYLKPIFGFAVLLSAFFSVLFFIIYLSEKQKAIEKNKILIFILFIVVYIAIEIYTEKSVPDIAHDVLTAVFGV